MKSIVFVLTLLITPVLCNAQEEEPKNYLLQSPDTWRKELIPFPLGFAPDLDYQGVEDIRFSKGWGDKESEEFWSYKFVWCLDKDPELTEDKLQNDFETYFDGLMGAVGGGKNIEKELITPTTALFLSKGDGAYKGRVQVFDAFFLEANVVLNFNVTSFYCEQKKKYVAYFEVSPQSGDHRIWKEMKDIKITDCQ